MADAGDRRSEDEGVLVLTVGTGDTRDPERTLFAPLRASIRRGAWREVVLLCSRVSEPYAQQLRTEISHPPIRVLRRLDEGLEHDVDRCFHEFDRVLSELRDGGYEPHRIIVDFTRGTKAMSAALVLAALRQDVPVLRYIVGERNGLGMVVPGTETVSEARPLLATARRTLDRAHELCVQGNFAAVLSLLPEPGGALARLWPEELAARAGEARGLAAFCSAWDRLDYREASRLYPCKPGALGSRWRRLFPDDAVRHWVEALASGAERDETSAMARRARRLAVDLLANGERRVRQRQFEDAVLRAYRVLELVGQARLFDHGLDSARLPCHHPAVADLARRMDKKGSAGFGRNRDGTLTAGREQVARLLKRLGDPLGRRLIDLAEGRSDLDVSIRNHSVLIHGFDAVGPADETPLRGLYRELAALLRETFGSDVEEWLAAARFLAFEEHTPPGSS